MTNYEYKKFKTGVQDNTEDMKQEFTLQVEADNNFSILNRIVNVLNRRRVRIKKLIAHENDSDFTRGGAIILIYTTADLVEKVKHQLEKCIEVEFAAYHEGSSMFYELSDRNNKQVA